MAKAPQRAGGGDGKQMIWGSLLRGLSFGEDREELLSPATLPARASPSLSLRVPTELQSRGWQIADGMTLWALNATPNLKESGFTGGKGSQSSSPLPSCGQRRRGEEAARGLWRQRQQREEREEDVENESPRFVVMLMISLGEYSSNITHYQISVATCYVQIKFETVHTFYI